MSAENNLDMVAAGKIAIELLQCAICTDIVIEPVFTCDEWHPVCGVCISKMHRPVCYCSSRLEPNMCAKQLLNQIYPALKCRNHKSGCDEVQSPSILLAHLKTCIYRPMKCPIQGLGCTKRFCAPQETYNHLKNDHRVEEKCAVEEKDGIRSFSHELRFSFGSIYAGISNIPVLLSSTQNFVLSYEILNGILIWWVCSDNLDVVCEGYKYDSLIKTSTTSNEITGLSLPIYGIRYIQFQKLEKINGAYSTFSANTLFLKKYEFKKYEIDDFVDVTIVVNVLPL